MYYAQNEEIPGSNPCLEVMSPVSMCCNIMKKDCLQCANYSKHNPGAKLPQFTVCFLGNIPRGVDSSVGRPSDWKTRRNTDAGLSPLCGQGFFLLELTSCADSLTVSVQPPCAIARSSICAHVKNPKLWQPYHCLTNENAAPTERNG